MVRHLDDNIVQPELRAINDQAESTQSLVETGYTQLFGALREQAPIAVFGSILVDDLLAAQLSMAPTDLIALEVFSTACLLGLSLERE